METHKLRFKKFEAQDFPKYKSWYQDADLNKHLGPAVDQEWLDSVMSQTDGCHYSVFLNGNMVAVLGIKFPHPKHPSYYLTEIAIKPSLRNRGIGSQVVEKLIKMHRLKPGQSWKTFINNKNSGAKRFFEKMGWVCQSNRPDKNNMLTFVYKTSMG